jgi:AcrR family transcriptional regulator
MAKAMRSPRRIGSEDSRTRAALLDAAQKLMLEEGYAAVTSRRVAAKAGLKPQLVHYYFRTMDDLFLAILRRGSERNIERQARALASPQPLRALWEFSSDPAGTRVWEELVALANHRKAIRDEIASYGERLRRLQAEALSSVLDQYGVDTTAFPPDALLTIMTALSRVLVMEHALGIRIGHAETHALVERFLAQFEGDAPRRRRGSSSRRITRRSRRA